MLKPPTLWPENEFFDPDIIHSEELSPNDFEPADHNEEDPQYWDQMIFPLN